MASLLHSESRRLYSWWWDSHNSPKNSKWLQENLKDMDAKVKAMIKLIEEDADSFARRAEMYYKKRPELMKLVEEFYRAYRALAERYDHATVELRQAHRTMAEAFPNQVPLLLAEDSPSGSSAHEAEPHTPEMPHPIRALLDLDDLSASDLHSIKRGGPYLEEFNAIIGKKGLKQLNEMFGTREIVPPSSKFAEGKIRKGLNNEMEENERGSCDGKAESEVQNLKKAISDMEAEKEAVLLQYQQSLEKISNLEEELNHAQIDFAGLDEQARKSATEVQTLKDILVKLEAERDAGSLQHKECLENISNLESLISIAHEDTKGLNERAIKVESETVHLKKEVSRLETEKEAGLLQYRHCLTKISDLENKLLHAEEEAKVFGERADRAETEVKKLGKALAELNEQKEAADLQCKHCLERISKLESEISCAREEILKGAEKLKNAEEKNDILETSNQSLKLEADNFAKKIEIKDQEILEKHEELEKFRICVKNENLRFVQAEATLLALQNLHSQSQEEQRALTLELKNGIQMLKDMEICKQGLEQELERVKGENQSLNELNSSSAISMNNLQNEILSLKAMKERLEEEVALQMSRSNDLQEEILKLKEEITTLNVRYHALMEDLQDENSKLRHVCEQDRGEKEALSKKLSETNSVLESSLLHVNGELEVSQEKVKVLEESTRFLQEEKSLLVAEKSSLLSQLQNLTEKMLKLHEKNTVLESSLCGANHELEGLREKSKSLEDICQLLNSEKSNLLEERGNLAIQLKNVEQRLENLEKRFTELEEKHSGLEKEKEMALNQIEELRFSLGVENQLRASFRKSNDARLASLENHIHLLQEESRWRKKEFEEELDKVMNAQFEIFILKRFIQDMEEKNYSLLIECQKHVEASRLSEKLISELESENLEQEMESELLLDEIEKLRLGIYQVFKALEIGLDKGCEENIENEQIYINHILGIIQDMKCSISNYNDDKQLLWVENSVLLTLLEQIRNEGSEIDLEKKILDRDFEIMAAELVVGQNEKHKILEENRSLLKKFSDVKEEKCAVEEQNEVILLETLALDNFSTIFKSFVTEKAVEVKGHNEHMHNLHGFNSDLEEEVSMLTGKIEMKETENLLLKDINDQLMEENSSGMDILRQKEKELSEAEQRLKATENLNSELNGTVEGLKWECEESKLVRENLERKILELSEDKTSCDKEILCLREVNEHLVSQMDKLREEIEARRIREENLSSELQERSNEFELWEDEAAAFYFDLQISGIRDALYENKVHELSGVCESLEDESALKTMEIVQMKERVSFMEREIGGLKAQLFAYAPLIVSLRENIASLEQHTLVRKKLDAADNQERKVSESAVHLHGESRLEMKKDQNLVPKGISDLHELQTRIKAVETLLVEEMDKLALQESSRTNIKLEAAMKEIEELKSEFRLVQKNEKQMEERGLADKCGDNSVKFRKTKSEGSEIRNGILMKDIPLDHVSEGSYLGTHKRGSGGPGDQMLELWETDENDCGIDQRVNETQGEAFETTEDDIVHHQFDELQVEKELSVDKIEVSTSVTEPNQDTNKRKILERLASDAQKLTTLKSTVQDLRRKVETNKKSKKAKEIDIETLKEQLQEVEETVVQQVVMNGKLIKNVEDGLWFSGEKASTELEEGRNVQRKRVTEQARKESEKLGRLQLEVQKIQYVLLKFEGGKKSKSGKRFSKSRTSIILRDFIHRGRKGSEKKRKSHLCGCWRSSSSGNGDQYNGY